MLLVQCMADVARYDLVLCGLLISHGYSQLMLASYDLVLCGLLISHGYSQLMLASYDLVLCGLLISHRYSQLTLASMTCTPGMSLLCNFVMLFVCHTQLKQLDTKHQPDLANTAKTSCPTLQKTTCICSGFRGK